MITDPRRTVLQIVNETCDAMKVRQVTTTSASLFTRTLVNLLNDLMEEMADAGTWNELDASAQATLVSGDSHVSIATTALATAKWSIHSIHHVFLSGRAAPLDLISDKAEMRLLVRTGSLGSPARFMVDGQDGLGNPRVALFPRPDESGNVITVHYQVRPPRYEHGTDDAEVVPFPARVVIAGLLAGAILDENGGAPTEQWKVQQQKFRSLLNSSMQRHIGKTGDHVSFVPGRGMRS